MNQLKRMYGQDGNSQVKDYNTMSCNIDVDYANKFFFPQTKETD